jgi:hypothetical protein
MNKLVTFAATLEAATGLALIVVPAVVVRWLLGEELSGVALAVGRVAGIGLFSLGLACWSGKGATRPALCAMLTYNLLITLYLLYLGIRGEWVGLLLWPAVVIHAALTLLLARAWFKPQTTNQRPDDASR